ncbi:MAG: serine/threonine protein kinase, partial [Nitrospira sp.]
DYVAPEQAKDARHADVRSDIYSLGCTLFKLLAGRAPFSGEEYDTFTKKVLAHHGTPAPPIEDLRSDVSPEVAAVLAKMLAKSPDDRYQTPNELGLALAPLSAGANLKALIASALAAPALEAAERDPSTDSQDLKKRETTGFRQTPTPYAASRPTASISLLRRAAIVSAGVVLVAAIALISFSLGGWTTRSPSGDTVVQGNAKVPSDLLSSGRTIGWPGQIGLPVFVPDTKHKLITMTSEMHHLVQFGEIRRGKQQISVDVQFTDETAWAGVFLGYRTEIVHGRPQAMFQLVHFRNSSKSEGKRTYRLSRQSVRLADFNRSLEAQMEDEIILISGVRPTFHLDLLFDQEGIAMIRVDNKEYPELLHANFTNGRDFDPNECWGRWGLYNCGPTTRFFNLEWKGLP